MSFVSFRVTPVTAGPFDGGRLDNAGFTPPI